MESSITDDWRSRFELADRARRASAASGLPGSAGGPRDALRHILGSAEATLSYGEAAARLASEVSERTSLLLGHNTKAESEMDLHNDAEGRRLAVEHGNMGDVVDEAVKLIGQGSSAKPGRATWNTPDPPPNHADQQTAKNAAQEVYDSDSVTDHQGKPERIDDDDEARAKRNENVARVNPDGEDDTISRFMEVVMWILALAPRTSSAQIADIIFEPDVGDEVRRQRLLAALSRDPLLLTLVAFLLPETDDTNEGLRRRVRELLRLIPSAPAIELQPDWTDPPKERRDGTGR